jgi:hypothetical protein
MADTVLSPTNLKLISAYFKGSENGALSAFAKEFRALSDTDKEQLGAGLRDGSMSY